MEEEFVGKAGGKRAIRRHHRERLKKARQFYWGRELLTDKRLIGILVNTSAICSCWTCRNQRRVTGEAPFQERKQLQVDTFEDFE